MLIYSNAHKSVAKGSYPLSLCSKCKMYIFLDLGYNPNYVCSEVSYIVSKQAHAELVLNLGRESWPWDTLLWHHCLIWSDATRSNRGPYFTIKALGTSSIKSSVGWEAQGVLGMTA